MTRPEELAMRVLELTDQQDWAGREALLTPDFDFVAPNGSGRGPAATTAYSRPFVGAFPGCRHEVDLVVAQGDVAAVEGRWIGTHSGPLPTAEGEIPATGKTITLPFTATMRARGDRLASMHVYFDQLAFLAQLGVVPQSQAA